MQKARVCICSGFLFSLCIYPYLSLQQFHQFLFAHAAKLPQLTTHDLLCEVALGLLQF